MRRVSENPTTGLEDNWKPEGALHGVTQEPTADFVECLGIMGSPLPMVNCWETYKAEPRFHSPATLLAFVTAGSTLARRSPEHVFPMLREIARMEHADDATMHGLTLLAADLGLDDVARVTFDRCRGRKMRVGFYHALMKVATQTMNEADMTMAMNICAEMASLDVPHTPASLLFVLHGVARLPRIPLEVVFNVMDFRLRANHDVEMCLLHQFFSLLEMLPGDQTKRAIEYLAQLNPDLIHRPISDIVTRPPVCHKVGCHQQDSMVQYFLLDVLSITIDPAKSVLPPNSYVLTLYSSVRSLSDKARTCGKDHPLRKKANALKSLMDQHPANVVVVPVQAELHVRRAEAPAAYTPHAKIISFLKGVQQCMACNATVIVVTADPSLIRQATDLNLSVSNSLPGAITLAAANQAAAAAKAAK